MRTTILSSLAVAFVALIPDVYAGCGVSFQYAFVNANGTIVQNWVQVTFQSNSDTADVHVPTGLYFKAIPLFASCFYTEGRLWRNGVLMQDWPTSAGPWTAWQHGLYKWYVEGHGNMGTGPVNRHFRVQGPLPTSLGPELTAHSFGVRSLAISEDSRYAYVECISDQATDLRVEVFTLEGRIQHSSSHAIQPGENRVPIALPQCAGALSVFRITTGEGVSYVRKVKL